MILKNQRWIGNATFLFFLFTLFACRVTLLPEYEKEIAAEINATAKKIDKFYLNMLEIPNENGARNYDKFIDQYVEIEADLNALLMKNKVRALNENSLRICEITIEFWKKYKNEHKKDIVLETGIIKLNRLTMRDLMYSMQVAEEGKKMAVKHKDVNPETN